MDEEASLSSTKPQEDWTPPEIEHLKLLLNQIIWENGRPTLTLREAEKVALDMLEILEPACR